MIHKLSDAQADRFEGLVGPHLPTLVRTAGYLTRSESEANDLVQETMVRALRAADALNRVSDVKSWLLTIERRTFIDIYRHDRRRRHNASLESIKGEIAATEPVTGRFDERWDHPEQLLDCFDDTEVIGALKGLPDEIRWTLMLVDVEQLDQSQAAQVLGVPVGTVKSRAHRGRLMLRDKLLGLAQRRRWVGTETQRGLP